MPRMSVTLDVPQLEMSSLNVQKPSNRCAMFVIAETPNGRCGRMC